MIDTRLFSVIIPTWNRSELLKVTLGKLRAYPQFIAEIHVYVDGGDEATISSLGIQFPEVQFFQGHKNIGPGGGRNVLLSKAQSPYILSLDDDSYPVSAGFFERALGSLEKYPTAGLLACQIYHKFEETPAGVDQVKQKAVFEGCGCIYRKIALKGVPGYVPVQWAYGVEEQDLALQLIDNGWDIFLDKSLVVFHNTDLGHHNDPKKNAAAIANRALLAYLRFPARYTWLGMAMFFNRIYWALKNSRSKGVLKGILMTPGLLFQYRHLRVPVTAITIRKWRKIEQG